ncbi:MAG TPA: isocitrate/isopropylmalate family dehydrogenase, partial [Methanofastidiosum sp.]|nr:isocitrate/isopropylmalate family dehydrogenase [Methanofastidiosum sp.]
MAYKICVIRGDGIENDVIDAGLKLLSHIDIDFDYTYAEAGYECYLKNGTSIPQKTIEACRNA